MTPPGPSDLDCKPYYTGQCLRDNVLSGEIFLHILNGPEYTDDEMTIDLCFDSCQDPFFKFAWLEAISIFKITTSDMLNVTINAMLNNARIKI